MARGGRVAHQNRHGPPRQRLVSADPSVAEVAPDVLQFQPRELTCCTGLDNLQVGRDGSTKKFLPTFGLLFGGGRLKLWPEFTPVAHEREYGHPTVRAEPPLLHALDEFTDGWFAQLRVTLQQMPFANAPLYLIR